MSVDIKIYRYLVSESVLYCIEINLLFPNLHFDSFSKVQEVWDAVRLQLRRYLMDRLLCHRPEHPGSGLISTPTIFKRVHCLQQLFFLYPESEVLTHYQVQ